MTIKMRKDFLLLKKEIQKIRNIENILSVVLYGSVVSGKRKVNDLDGIIIVNKVDSSVMDFFNLLKSRYKKLDFNIYSQEELTKKVSYYTREFKLEYLAKGLCVYGKNLLKEEFSKISIFEYRQSLLIRSIEHMQMVRQKFFTSDVDDVQKREYIEKYFWRISRNILLFKGGYDHSSVNRLNKKEVLRRLHSLKLYHITPKIDSKTEVNKLFNYFSLISDAIIQCRKDLLKR